MLQLYDLNKVKIKGLRLYKDYCIESVLTTGDKTLSFLYPSRLSKDIKEESYIRTKNDEFVIKEISTNGEWNSIKATLNVENLEGQAWEHFDTTEKTIAECLTLAVAGTGWTVQVNGVTKKRTIRKTNCSTWDIIQQAKKTYLVEIEFDTINKIVKVAEKLGSDKGVYFMDSLNLRNLDVQSNSYDFFTRIIAIGKDDLKVTVENYQYSSKKKTFIWKDERYTDINSLTEDATKKLEEISKPYKAYGADIIDLANTSNKYSILNYGLGDTITLISKDKGIKEKQRIVKITEYPEEPHRNSCEIANSILSFTDIQKEYNDTVDTVSNITTDNGTVDGSTVDSITTKQISDFEASVGKITDLTVVNARIDNLYAEKADVGSLNAVLIRVGDLEATSATITQLKAVNASIVNLQANKANITDLTASVGRIEILESSVGDIQTLVNGNLTSNNIQSLILSSDKVTVVNGFIKNAMIENLDVSKINAGDISVNKFRIKSDSGNLLIFDNTIQIKDSTRVRVQIGKDASNDYNMYVWDSTGKLMFDATGLKADGIKNKIIRDDMVSDNANISGNKLNISSVVTSINNGVATLNSSKVHIDGTAQTLDVAFNTLTTKVDSAPPTIITDSSITKLDGAIDGMLKINSISGMTLQNLIKTIRTDIMVQYGSVALWKLYNPSTVYTIIVTNKSTETKQFYINEYCFTAPIEFTVQATQTSVIKATTLSSFTGSQSIVEILLKNKITHTQPNNLEVVVLEGDWTNKEIPYFEGIRSVGESENLEVVSCGKNLARYLNDKKVIRQGVTYDIKNGHYVITGTATGSGGRMSDTDVSLIKIYKGKTYTLSVNNLVNLRDTIDIAISNADTGGAIKIVPVTTGIITFTAETDFNATIGINTILDRIYDCSFDVMLEEGDTTATPYEPYKEHRQTIPLTNPLRGLPNNVRDIAKGSALTRNVGKVVLKGSSDEIWYYYSSGQSSKTDVMTFYTPLVNKKVGFEVICDRFPTGVFGDWDRNIVGITGHNTLQTIYINCPKSYLSTQDVPGFKAWLQANPVTVYYQLATPVKEPIDVTQYMKQFKDGYFLTEGSLINPTVDLTYSTSLASSTSMMKEVTESNATALNIQQGKISTLISNTTIVKDGQNIQLKDAYNSTVATVNSINSVISSHTSTIDALTGQITGVDTRTNEIKRTLDGTVATVSNHTTSINGLNSTVSTQSSTIAQMKDSIALKVEETEVTNIVNGAVDKIEVGGRNLIIEKNGFMSYTPYNSIPTISNHVISTTRTGNSYFTICNNSLKPNGVYTLSGTFLINGNPVTNAMFLIKTANTYGTTPTRFYIDDTTGRFEITQNFPGNGFLFHTQISPSLSGDIVTIKDFKLEKGNKATDWTPAPEDVDSYIKSVDERVTVVSNKAASIETSLTGITSRVSNVETTTSTLNGDITLLTTRMTNAEQKITDSSIISTVSNTVYDLAKAMGDGVMLYPDASFTTGTNRMTKYNNSGGIDVVLNRILKPTDCPTTSTHCIEIKVIGTNTSPGLGGFYFGNTARPNAIFILKMTAKIPVGSKLMFASNAYGTGGSAKWLTSNEGTGKWQEYIHKVTCGSEGTFSTTNFFYIDKGTIPFMWRIASATIYDITDTADLNMRINTAEQKITDSAIVSTVRSSTYYKNDLTGKVSTKEIISCINQTAESIKISASKINLTGYVTMTNLSTAGQTTIDGGNIKTNTISLERLKSATKNPIIRLFGKCSLDATANNELGVGSAVRLKWNSENYVYVSTNNVAIYQNSNRCYEFTSSYFSITPAVTYFAHQCKVDASAGTFRFYISKSVDTGIRISPDGTISFMVAGTPRHVFNTNGTKAGGTVEVDGATLGMSPIDSPQVLLENVLFDIDIQEEGTIVSLDSTFIKTISKYAVFCSDPSVNIVSKDRTSFYVQGYTGKADFRVIGYRIGYEEQYYQVVG